MLNWNGAEKTLECVAGLAQSTHRNLQIVVVDNASRAADLARLRQAAAARGFTLIENGVNGGYAEGHRRSVEMALAEDADFVCLLNNDLHVPPETVAKLVAAQRTQGGIVGGAPVDVPLAGVHPDLDAVEAPADALLQIHRKYLGRHFRQMIFAREQFLPYLQLRRERGPITEVSGLSGSCLLLPMPLIRAHGFMDPGFFLYFEEMDYLFRLSRSGVRLWLCCDAPVWHEREGSSSGQSSRIGAMIQYYRIRNQIHFIRRYGSGREVAMAQVKNLLLAGAALLRGRWRRAAYVLRGAWDGQRGIFGKTVSPEDALDP